MAHPLVEPGTFVPPAIADGEGVEFALLHASRASAGHTTDHLLNAAPNALQNAPAGGEAFFHDVGVPAQ